MATAGRLFASLIKSPDLALVCVLFLVDLKGTGEVVDMLGLLFVYEQQKSSRM